MNKSMKYEQSIKQIRNDTLLGITVQPENTCPLIDPLKSSERSKDSRNLKSTVKLGENPDSYYVAIDDLISRSQQLREWSEEMIHLFENNATQVPEKKELYGEIIQYIQEIKSYIKDNEELEYDLSQSAEKINDFINDWEKMNVRFFDAEQNKIEIEKEVNGLESEIDSTEDEEELYELTTKIEDSNEQLQYISKEVEGFERDFTLIERGLEDNDITLDADLEKYRTNNDHIRVLTSSVRKYLFENNNGNINIQQPMDYLKTLENESKNELSLGILDNDSKNFKKITEYLSKNGIISDLQKLVLDKLISNDSLIETLKRSGYENIRYYKSAKDFLINKDDFMEVKNIKQDANIKYKVRI